MDKLISEFKDSIVPDMEDNVKEYLELGIDYFIKDGILKDIPIVNSIVGGLRLAKNLQDRNLLKQTLTFIVELNNGIISNIFFISFPLFSAIYYI